MAARSRAASRCRPASGQRLADRCGVEGGPPRSRCRHRLRPFAGGAARRMAGRSAALARYRPRDLGRPGAAAVARQARLLAENAVAGAVEDRPARQRDAGRRAAVSTASMPSENSRSKSSAASLGRLTALIAPFAPRLARAARRDGDDPGPGARETDSRSSTRTPERPIASMRAPCVDLDAPQLKGIADDRRAAGRCGGQWHRSRRARAQRVRDGDEIVIPDRAAPCSRCSVSIERVAAGEGPSQFEGTATRRMGPPLRLKARIAGTGLDADAEGSAEPWAPDAKANLSLKVRSADLGAAARPQTREIRWRRISACPRASLSRATA